MNAQLPEPQEQKPKRPEAIGMLASTGFISLLALLWHVIGRIWSTVIVGGFLVGLLISYSLTGTSGLPQPDPRTWFITRQLLAHSLVTAIVLIVAVLFTFVCYLAARHEKRERQEQRQAQQETLVDIGRGVRKLLEEAHTKPAPTGNISTHADLLPPSISVWTVPYSRNPFFTGREHLLKQLHERLMTTKAAALTQALAISGLGGIGKTQIAVEYAYRYRQEYQKVLWAQAESAEALTTSYVALATPLGLPIQDAQNQTITVQAVKRWLQDHHRWLLILDNVDEPALLPDFLPPDWNGHLLLTTRAQAMGHLASCIWVEELPPNLGALLLLRRAKVLDQGATLTQASPTDQVLATKISQELGGLPLALDEAGAYLEATGESLSGYSQVFEQYRAKLLKERRALLKDHPEPVTTTLLLSFDRVERKSQAAADLLRLCAYLAPETIAEEIITQGAPYLGSQLESMVANPYQFNQAIAELRNYSLIGRDSEKKILSVHRLVQAVLQDAMPVEMRKQWKERAVNAVNATFPGPEPSHWTMCERWLPHAFICANWIEQEQMIVPVASSLLTQAGLYVKERAQYTQAELFFRQALVIDEQVYGPEHLEIATDLNNLACLYWNQGKYGETEPLFQRALAIRQQRLGHEDPATAETFQNLACLYQTRGKYKEAESFFRQALVINKKMYGPDHPEVGTSLGNHAELYRRLGRYQEAGLMLEGALRIYEKHWGPEHLNTAYILHKQALLSYDRSKYQEAERLFVRTRKIYEKYQGHEHPNTAQILHGLAEVSRVQGKYEEAEELFQRALAIIEQKLGPQHSSTAAVLNGMALLYLEQGKYIYVKQKRCMTQGRYEEAEKLLQRALEIRGRCLGQEHPDTALILHNLALFYGAQERHEWAEELFQHCLIIWQQQLGSEHPYIVHTLYHLGLLYQAQKRYEEAEEVFQRVLEIRERHFGQEHPDTVLSLYSLALLSYDQKRYEEAEEVFQRILAIHEKRLGSEHPETQLVLRNAISLLWTAGRDIGTLRFPLHNDEK